jgi:hypothetical protein
VAFCVVLPEGAGLFLLPANAGMAVAWAMKEKIDRSFALASCSESLIRGRTAAFERMRCRFAPTLFALPLFALLPPRRLVASKLGLSAAIPGLQSQRRLMLAQNER